LAQSKLSIPPAEFETRLSSTREELRERRFDALLAVSGYAERDGNVCYLCGHKNTFPYSNASRVISGLGYSVFIVPLSGQTTLIAPLGYQQDAVSGVDKVKTGTNLTQELIIALRESHFENSRLALAGSDIIPSAYMDELRKTLPSLRVEYQDELIAQERMTKSENELALMRHASKIADKALRAAMESIKPGMAESAIGTVARKKAMELGADYVVRDRVHSGPEIGRLRWPFASGRKVRKGEMVSVDFVGWVNGYGFDILRVGCAGRPNKEQRAVIETAGEATETMSDELVANKTVVASISQLNHFRERGYHVSPFGHAIGLEIVESPYLLPGVTDKIKRNMVFCVEPDVKKGKYSASIENEVIVTDGKPEVLTKLPLDFID
jgi:Xaa-Pro aminopeptidase